MDEELGRDVDSFPYWDGRGRETFPEGHLKK